MSLYVRVSGDDSLPLGEDYPMPRRFSRDD